MTTPERRHGYRPTDTPTHLIRVVPSIGEPATDRIPVADPTEPAPPPDPGDQPILVQPLLTNLVPALILALLVGVVAGGELAPYLGAAIGAVGAAAGLRKAL